MSTLYKVMNSLARQQWWLWIMYYMCSKLAAADLEQVCFHGQNVNDGLCGPHLSGILKLLCGSEGYNGFRKRSEVAPLAQTASVNIDDLAAHKVFLPKSEAVSYLSKRTLNKWTVAGTGYQGIVCECCYNRCDIMELKQYCAGPNLYGLRKRTQSLLQHQSIENKATKKQQEQQNYKEQKQHNHKQQEQQNRGKISHMTDILKRAPESDFAANN